VDRFGSSWMGDSSVVRRGAHAWIDVSGSDCFLFPIFPFFIIFSFTSTLVCSLDKEVTHARIPWDQRGAQSSDLLPAFDFRWEKGRRPGALQEIELSGYRYFRINEGCLDGG